MSAGGEVLQLLVLLGFPNMTLSKSWVFRAPPEFAFQKCLFGPFCRISGCRSPRARSHSMGNHFNTPTPTYKAKIWTKTWPKKQSSLPCFKAFWARFRPDFCVFLFSLHVGSLVRFWFKKHQHFHAPSEVLVTLSNTNSGYAEHHGLRKLWRSTGLKSLAPSWPKVRGRQGKT